MNYYMLILILVFTIVRIIVEKKFDNCDLSIIITYSLFLAIGYYKFKYPTKTPWRIISHNGTRYVLECVEEVEALEKGMKQADAYIIPVVEACVVKYPIIPTAYANLV